MREQEFKDHYVATFLATYAAMHYENACAMGQHYRLEKDLAVEDARYLADRAWEQVMPNTPDQPVGWNFINGETNDEAK